MKEAVTNINFSNIIQFWDNEYKKGFIYGTEPSETAKKTVKLLKSSHVLTKELKILEIGGGYGRNAIYIAKELKTKVHVLEISQQAINLGRKLIEKDKSLVEFIFGNINYLNKIYKLGIFDIVFHNFCLHLLGNKTRAVIYNNVSQVLKTRGWFIGSFLSINDQDFCEKLAKENTIILRGKQQHFFSREEITNELKDYFDIVLFEESVDKEIIISNIRNTTYYFVLGIKR